MKKIILFMMLATLLLASFHKSKAGDAGTAATFTEFKAPQYDGKGKLMFIIYGKSGYSSGINVFMNEVLIDTIKNNIDDIDQIKDFKKLKVYDIDENQDKVMKFWESVPHSEALLYALQAVYNRANQTIKGDKILKFRSRFVDIDGVGFDGDYFSRKLHIRKNVKVIIRSDFFQKQKNSTSKNK